MRTEETSNDEFSTFRNMSVNILGVPYITVHRCFEMASRLLRPLKPGAAMTMVEPNRAAFNVPIMQAKL